MCDVNFFSFCFFFFFWVGGRLFFPHSFTIGCINTTPHHAAAKTGLDPAEVAELVGETFNEQIFQHGFVHCDPHPGNVLVRPRPTPDSSSSSSSSSSICGGGGIEGNDLWRVGSIGRNWFASPLWDGGNGQQVGSDSNRSGSKRGAYNPPQLVLLDHGLYRELPDGLRLSYARFWMSIMLQDQAGMKAQADTLGAGKLYPLLACMLTRKSWDKIMPNAVADDPHSAVDVHVDIAKSVDSDTAQQQQQQQPASGLSPQGRGGLDAAVLKPDDSAEAKAELQDNVAEYAKEIVLVLSTVNRDLLLLFKTNDCLMHLAHELGAYVEHVISTERSFLFFSFLFFSFYGNRG